MIKCVRMDECVVFFSHEYDILMEHNSIHSLYECV
jgi:hypothetical protein